MPATAVPSGALTGTTTLFTGKNYLNSIQATTDGTNDAVVTVYDNTTGSGTVIAVLTVLGANKYGGMPFEVGVRCKTGLTVVVTGTGATGYVTYGSSGG